MKLNELLKLDEEERSTAYMRVLGLEEVDVILVLERTLDEIVLGHVPMKREIVLTFARKLKLACTRLDAPGGTIRAELDVEGGVE